MNIAVGGLHTHSTSVRSRGAAPAIDTPDYGEGWRYRLIGHATTAEEACRIFEGNGVRDEKVK